MNTDFQTFAMLFLIKQAQGSALASAAKYRIKRFRVSGPAAVFVFSCLSALWLSATDTGRKWNR